MQEREFVFLYTTQTVHIDISLSTVGIKTKVSEVSFEVRTVSPMRGRSTGRSIVCALRPLTSEWVSGAYSTRGDNYMPIDLETSGEEIV